MKKTILLIISVITLLSFVLVTALANESADGKVSITNNTHSFSRTNLDASAARNVYTDVYEDSYMRLTMLALDMSGGRFDLSIDAEWKVMPKVRYYDAMSIGVNVKAMLIEGSQYGWISYDSTYTAFTNVYEFEKISVFENMQFDEMDSWRPVAYGVVFKMPENYVDVASGTTVSYSNLKVHYECSITLVDALMPTAFNVYARYNHSEHSQSGAPIVEYSNSLISLKDQPQYVRRETCTPTPVEYYPDNYYD